MVRRGEQSIALVGVRGPGTVEQVEQVVSESAVVGEGGTVDSPGRRTGARDGGAGGVGRLQSPYPAWEDLRSDARCCRTLAVPFQWYCWCSGGVRQRCLSVLWYLKARDQMIYVATIRISEGTWEL